MSMSRIALSGVFLLSAANLCAGQVAAQKQTDAGLLTAPMIVNQTTQVPGKLLKPGSYTIRVVDHLSDRVILQVEDGKGQRLSTFLGLEASGLRSGNTGSGPVLWANGPHKTAAVRGYSFPGGSTVEFVYPKDDAVSIAKVNTDKVAAIDPASEGRVTANHLSPEDLQMVTLWTLSSTRVGPEGNSQPAIAAERYHAPAQVTQTEPLRTRETPVSSAVAPVKAIAPVKTASIARRAPLPLSSRESGGSERASTMTSLPHTASDLPVLGLAGILMIVAGCGLRSRRFAKIRG